MATRYFVGQYIASAAGKTGLTVTVDIWRLSDQVQVVTGLSATELGRGSYMYAYASADIAEEYVCVFHTTDGTVDAQDIFAHDKASGIMRSTWDRVLSTATHNIAQSAGQRLRRIAGYAVHEGTAQGSGTGPNQIQLDTGASAVGGAYDPGLIVLIGGTGDGQQRLILQYDGPTRTATVDRDWKVLPDATTEFQLIADAGREHVNEGLAQGGDDYTIILNPLASDEDGAYIGQVIFIRSGTGQDQARRCSAYDGATKEATVLAAWDPVPDTTSAYVALPTAAFDIETLLSQMADYVWDEAKADHTTVGSFGAETGLLTTIVNRLGAFAGTGVNTVLGFFRALLRKDATLPSDIGGTYAATTDSQEGARDTTPPAVWSDSEAPTRILTGGQVITVPVESRVRADIAEDGVSFTGEVSDIYRGTTRRFDVALSIAGLEVDITADTVTFRIKPRQEDTDAQALLTKAADVATQGADGIASFHLEPSDTDIAVESYPCDIEWARSNGDNYIVYSDPIQILRRTSDVPD
jgi:hypothetical protein